MEENQVKAHGTAVSRQKMMASNLQKQLEERKAIAKAEAEERNRYVEEQKKKIKFLVNNKSVIIRKNCLLATKAL